MLSIVVGKKNNDAHTPQVPQCAITSAWNPITIPWLFQRTNQRKYYFPACHDLLIQSKNVYLRNLQAQLKTASLSYG